MSEAVPAFHYDPAAGTGALLAPRQDVDALAATFAQRRRVIVPDLLERGFADALHACLRDWREWALVTRVAGVHRNFDAAQMDMIDPAKRAELDALISVEARAGFQYLYERYPLADPDYTGVPSDPRALAMQHLLGSDAFVALARRVTGFAQIRFADGQMTRYRRGHYLTQHDDHADGKQRLAAYVLSLSRDWSADHGGQLQFIAADGGVDEVVMPRFNTLALFEVPVPHLVTSVAPFVQASRLSITGWLRY